MKKKLIIVGGIINLFFLLFHIHLAFAIGNLSDLPPHHKVLMQMLNIGGIGLVAFFTFGSFFNTNELIASRLGRNTLILIFLTYFIRAGEEILFLGTNLNLPILISCLMVSFLYLFILILKK